VRVAGAVGVFRPSGGNPAGRGARYRQPNRRPAGEIDRTDNDRGDTGASARRPRRIRESENNKNLRSISQRRARPAIRAHVSRASETVETRGTRKRLLACSTGLLPDRTCLTIERLNMNIRINIYR